MDPMAVRRWRYRALADKLEDAAEELVASGVWPAHLMHEMLTSIGYSHAIYDLIPKDVNHFPPTDELKKRILNRRQHLGSSLPFPDAVNGKAKSKEEQMIYDILNASSKPKPGDM